jgi:hypothetical protein
LPPQLAVPFAPLFEHSIIFAYDAAFCFASLGAFGGNGPSGVYPLKKMAQMAEKITEGK